MIGRFFKHGNSPRLEIVRSVRTKSCRRFTLSAHAFKTLETTSRRFQHLEIRHDDGLVHFSDDAKQGSMAILHDRNLDRSRNAGQSNSKRAMIAFGSNLGDMVGHIEEALKEMARRQLKVKSVSGLYETDPMYVTNQQKFLNGVCEVKTDLDAFQLLDVLQGIENDLGRERKVDKGPRNIDLDILLYEFEQVSHERLHIPHRLMLEREFVLRPLADLIPQERLPPATDLRTIQSHLMDLEHKAPGKRPDRVTAIAPHLPLLKATDPTRSTHLMAILNLTPDSFSDGNVHLSTNIEALEKTIKNFINAGATIIDIGGQSTRPNAEMVSPAIELGRILPAIRHIRCMPETKNVAISVDTFYASVAEECVAAGADIINDITAGEADPQMLATAARLQKTIILMHMRGTPQTMTKLTHYPDGVITGVGEELSMRVEAAKAAGIRPWRIILDPGIGFAKTQDQNLELLRHFDELRVYKSLKGYPWLVGPSRKGFIGKITGVKNAQDRAWGTAAAVTASIKGGADILRVHDVAEMTQVAKMADAIFRTEDKQKTSEISSSQAFAASTSSETS